MVKLEPNRKQKKKRLYTVYALVHRELKYEQFSFLMNGTRLLLLFYLRVTYRLEILLWGKKNNRYS